MNIDRNHIRIKQIKQVYCQKLFDGEVSEEQLKEVEKRLAAKDTKEGYYQAEAIRQTLEWWDSLGELTN